MKMLSYWLIALISCTQHQARGKSPDEGKCEESQERKTALVTGAAGFIGHHVIEGLLDSTDWNIVSLDRLDFSGNLNRIQDMLKDKEEEVKRRVRIIFCDLRIPISDQLAMDIGPVDYILHLAAGSHVDRSIEHPLEFVMDNVVGTVNILDFARLHQPCLDRFVYFSTDEVFGPAPRGVAYAEYDRYNSGNPYAAAKAGGEEFAVAYENTYKMPIVVTHTMNVFGERQNPEKFIPGVVSAVRDGMQVTIHSDSSRTIPGSRHYIHVKDVVEGLRFILSLPKDYKHQGEACGATCPKFNLVGPEEVDNLQLSNMIAAVIGKDLNYTMVDFHSARPGHDLRYAISGDLLKSLGWEPSTRLSQRIGQFTHWMLDNPRWLDKPLF